MNAADGKSIPNLKYDAAGLVPAICQDAASGDILMLGYMSEDALAQTLASGTYGFSAGAGKSYGIKGRPRVTIYGWLLSRQTAMTMPCL